MHNTLLFIGRFQPFHKGHFSVVERALQQAEKIIIAIGSSQFSHQVINPFSYEERKEMVFRALEESNIDMNKIHICAVPDIGDDKKWVQHVQGICGNFDGVITGENEGYLYIKRLFEAANIPVIVVENIIHIDASTIRQQIKQGKDWQKSLFPSTVTYLENIDGKERILHPKETGEKKS